MTLEQAAAAALEAAVRDYRIIEQQADRMRDPERYVIGDAADLSVLERAGIRETSSVMITTHDDDVNVYLTIYSRRLRPDVQIIARARLDRNVSTLHRAGADAVLSYSSTGATAVWNVLSHDDILQIAEGLDVFRVPVPAELAGRALRESHIRETTGCTVVAVAANGQLSRIPIHRPRCRPAPTSCSSATRSLSTASSTATATVAPDPGAAPYRH